MTKASKPANQEIVLVPVAELQPSNFNPRKDFDEGALMQLAESIRELGVQVPLLVRPASSQGGLEIVAGHRRAAAARKAGLQTVPCLVREMTDGEALQVMIVENLQRADLSPMEEADGYRVLIRAMGEPNRETCVEEIARRSGKPSGYVRSRLRLLGLIEPAQRALREKLLTFDAALLIAKLEPAYQDRATAQALSRHGAQGRTAEVVLRDVLEGLAEERHWREEVNDAAGYEVAESLFDPMPAPKLKAWIAENVLLSLANAAWPLHDDALLPVAGACASCPKRSGADGSLFAELTTRHDLCTDPACYAAKKKAFVAIQKQAAKASGKPVLKLSRAEGYAPIAVGADIEKTKFKRGQWVEAAEGECADTFQGLTEEGELLWVCVSQKCKRHEHRVVKPAEPYDWKAEQEKRDAAAKAYEQRETPIREAVVKAIQTQGKATVEDALRFALLERLNVMRNPALACRIAGLDRAGKANDKLLRDAIAKAKVAGLVGLALAIFAADAAPVHGYEFLNPGTDREDLWALAKAWGVDAGAIARKLEATKPKPEKAANKKSAKPKAAKRAAKKAARR